MNNNFQTWNLAEAFESKIQELYYREMFLDLEFMGCAVCLLI
jgi:hypothetical protein